MPLRTLQLSRHSERWKRDWQCDLMDDLRVEIGEKSGPAVQFRPLVRGTPDMADGRMDLGEHRVAVLRL